MVNLVLCKGEAAFRPGCKNREWARDEFGKLEGKMGDERDDISKKLDFLYISILYTAKLRVRMED